MICDDRRPEDLDTTLEDHALDALRYGISSTQVPDDPTQRKNAEQLKYEKLISPEPEQWTYEWQGGK
jgi:hypothetical protein